MYFRLYKNIIAFIKVSYPTLLLWGVAPAVYAECTDNWAAKLTSKEGAVEIQRANTSAWESAEAEAILCQQDKIRTLELSRAMLVLNNQTYVRLDEKTTLAFAELNADSQSFLELIRGKLYSISRVPNSLNIKTPYVNAAIKGTEFLITADDQGSQISVFEGEVEATNAQGSINLPSGTAAIAKAGQAPVAILAIPLKDAVEWALYYPPIIDSDHYNQAGFHFGIKDAVAAYSMGMLEAAHQALTTVPEAQHDSDFFTLKAALLLTSGRVNQAREALNEAAQLKPNQPEIKALSAMIHLARMETELALENAKEAVDKAPESSLAWVALSYTQQSQFKLEQAELSAKKAVALNPENARAWSRLAELQLSLGETEAAIHSANRSIELAPQLPHSHSLHGFTLLMQQDSKGAKRAFEHTLELESNAPLARLGLGLSLIRDGDLALGREQLEIAAVLDPQNSLIRSYLGKAYYDERRESLAAKELAMAKLLDPNDPTPWFYDAILQQTINRHHDALKNLEKAIDLNDNRAVYRSRLLLDQDLAARVVSMSRIHEELGFTQSAINQSSISLDHSPTNYSAHRFLFDSYRNRQRHESSRVSELLQTQLLQPINMNPVQPELTVTDLNILSGTSPSQLGFNEFTPLFERDGIQFTGGAQYGSNETLGDQAVISGVQDRFSYSLGQFHYETDGWRANNEQRHKILDLFTQVAVTDELDLQLEIRRRKSEEGDLRLNFDPADFSRHYDREIEQETKRLGIHYQPTQRSDFISSFSYTDRQEDLEDTSYDFAERVHGFDAQLRYTYQGESFNVTSGVGHYDYDGKLKTDVTLAQPSMFLPFNVYTTHQDGISSQLTEAYIYSNINFPSSLTWTIGVNAISYRDGIGEVINFDRINPKFGLQWQATDYLRLRAAAFKTVKRSEVFEQTLEPTQIAAFNQVYDDFNGTIAKQYGFAIDLTPTDNLFLGAEIFRRNLDIHKIFTLTTSNGTELTSRGLRQLLDFDYVSTVEEQREDIFRAYTYWTPLQDWSMSLQLQRRRFRRSPAQLSSTIGSFNYPIEVKTTEIPFELRYFSENGFFANFKATHVRQRVELPPVSTYDKGKEDFIIVDAAIGYRFPKRYGLVTLSINNLFDEDFLFQDENIQTADPSDPKYIPDQTILLRTTINF